MRKNNVFGDRSQPPGLVLVFPRVALSLFDPQVHRLVREVERRLDDVFVTYAVSNGGRPDVESAVNAARFAGCSSAVVVYPQDWFGDQGWVEATSDSRWSVGPDAAGLRDTADRAVEAYGLSRSTAGVAA